MTGNFVFSLTARKILCILRSTSRTGGSALRKTILFVTAITLAIGTITLNSTATRATEGASAYAESSDGLKQLVTDLIALAHKKDKAALSAAFESLELPNHSEWFNSEFGSAEGMILDAQYSALLRESRRNLDEFLKHLSPDATISVSVSTPTSTPNPTSIDDFAIGRMSHPLAIYAAIIPGKNGYSSILNDFIYVNGAFRHVEPWVWYKLKNAPVGRIRMGGSVMAAKIKKKINPAYPAGARSGFVQGTVRVRVVLAVDGTVKDAQIVSGDSQLTQNTLEAVRQWVYEPTLLNGVPVEVETVVDVVFSLQR